MRLLQAISSGPGRFRTCDLGIKSPAEMNARGCHELRLAEGGAASALQRDEASRDWRRQAGTPIRTPRTAKWGESPDSVIRSPPPTVGLTTPKALTGGPSKRCGAGRVLDGQSLRLDLVDRVVLVAADL